MEKRYIKPDTNVIELATEGFIANSPVFSGDGDSGQGDLNDEEAQGPALSKEHSFDIWDMD